ncbi:uncharacterized protein [Drosophila tropicalis]|uniref:uncharacterized protein n=1 Tax=Drosophila tropicalis TaxID=46794 RepID=UPI0035ABEAE3
MNKDQDICSACNKSRLNSSTQHWVQCDNCQKWYHFQCAGVNSSIAEAEWICNSCQQALDNVASTSTGRDPSTGSPNIPYANKATEQQCPEPHAANASYLGKVNLVEQTQSPSSNYLMLAMLEERREAEKRYIEQKYNLLAQQQGTQVSCFQLNGPTASQLAARQVLPADLPIFNGNPEDWPIFISMYENSCRIAGFSNAENMLRLQKSLKGKAYELVRDKLLLPILVPDVINTLKTFFGRPEQILDRLIDKIRKINVHKDKLESIVDFAMAVRNACATMEACNLTSHLNNPMLLRELIDKLPTQQKLNWAMHPRNESIPVIKSFSDWLYKIAEAAATVMPGQNTKANNVNTHSQAHQQPQEGPNNRENGWQQNCKPKLQCVMCASTDHQVALCQSFKRLSVDDRQRIINEAKVCYRCLKSHRRKCFSNRDCGIDNCNSKHHPLLHKGTGRTEVVTAHHKDNVVEGQFFRVVPIKLYGANVTFNTFAFLDEGSSVTLIDETILDKLKISSTPEPICLQWTGEETRNEEDSVKTHLQISEAGTDKKLWLYNVHSVKKLGLPKQTINVEELSKQYPYLRGLPLKSYQNGTPLILIGSNNWNLAIPRKIREGRRNEPIASKCTLGWCIQGSTNSSKHVTMHHCECNWSEIDKAIKESFTMEPIVSREMQSKNDKRAKGILEDTCKMINGRYEVGLLWKDDTVILPESYTAALKRLECLRAKIKRMPELFDKIQSQIDNLLQKGYAFELRPEEISDRKERVWYLPIFIALNPNKPNKIRLVWDAAAKSHGKSLNDFMLTGPDYLNPLTSVLMAFRVGRIAVCADIAEMFHQINIQESDMHVQRFLWLNKNENTPRIFVMRAMTFGINCAPCIAHYVRDKNAENFQIKNPRAYESITKAHYVDDLIDSFKDELEAITVTSSVRDIHADGGFQIRNWCSNSASVLQNLGEQQINQHPKELGNPEKVLGVDYFGPILVNVGRHKEKRWGVLFTCLTLRAVHLEVAYKLDVSSCIMCLKNFMALRGTPREIFSDNGTNFKATEKLVKEELVKIDFDQIAVHYEAIKCRFNPPAAPHMGGAWERLVRTVKSVLKAICPSSNFNDETLRSALMEAEFIINSRPLTFVSLDTGDDEALTPNHLLLGSKAGYKPVSGNVADLRLRWHQTQSFADRFWKRWVKEYTPTLTRRSKWFTKRPPVDIGDVVIVVDDNLPRNLWPKGRITDVVTAKDGQVRRATKCTPNGIMIRPVSKIAVLDVGLKEMPLFYLRLLHLRWMLSEHRKLLPDYHPAGGLLL